MKLNHKIEKLVSKENQNITNTSPNEKLSFNEINSSDKLKIRSSIYSKHLKNNDNRKDSLYFCDQNDSTKKLSNKVIQKKYLKMNTLLDNNNNALEKSNNEIKIDFNLNKRRKSTQVSESTYKFRNNKITTIQKVLAQKNPEEFSYKEEELFSADSQKINISPEIGSRKTRNHNTPIYKFDPGNTSIKLLLKGIDIKASKRNKNNFATANLTINRNDKQISDFRENNSDIIPGDSNSQDKANSTNNIVNQNDSDVKITNSIVNTNSNRLKKVKIKRSVPLEKIKNLDTSDSESKSNEKSNSNKSVIVEKQKQRKQTIFNKFLAGKKNIIEIIRKSQFNNNDNDQDQDQIPIENQINIESYEKQSQEELKSENKNELEHNLNINRIDSKKQDHSLIKEEEDLEEENKQTMSHESLSNQQSTSNRDHHDKPKFLKKNGMGNFLRSNQIEMSMRDKKNNRHSSRFLQNLILLMENKHKTNEEKLIDELVKPKMDPFHKLQLFFSEFRNIPLITNLILKYQGFLKFVKFNGIDDDSIKELAHYITYKHYSKGNVIYRQGAKATAAYCILEGKVGFSEVNFNKSTLDSNSEDEKGDKYIYDKLAKQINNKEVDNKRDSSLPIRRLFTRTIDPSEVRNSVITKPPTVSHDSKKRHFNFTKKLFGIKKAASNLLCEILFKNNKDIDLNDLKSKEIKSLGPGSFFGEANIIHQTKRTETATALEDCHLFTIEKADFDKVITKCVIKSEQDRKIKLFDYFLPFQNFSKSKFDELYKKVVHKFCHKGEIIFEEGSLADKIVVVYQGECELYKNKDVYFVPNLLNKADNKLNEYINNNKLSKNNVKKMINTENAANNDIFKLPTIKLSNNNISQDKSNNNTGGNLNIEGEEIIENTENSNKYITAIKKKIHCTNLLSSTSFIHNNVDLLRVLLKSLLDLSGNTWFDKTQNICLLKYVKSSIAGFETVSNLSKEPCIFRSTLISSDNFTTVLILSREIIEEIMVYARPFLMGFYDKQQKLVCSLYDKALSTKEKLKLHYNDSLLKMKINKNYMCRVYESKAVETEKALRVDKGKDYQKHTIANYYSSNLGRTELNKYYDSKDKVKDFKNDNEKLRHITITNKEDWSDSSFHDLSDEAIEKNDLAHIESNNFHPLPVSTRYSTHIGNSVSNIILRDDNKIFINKCYKNENIIDVTKNLNKTKNSTFSTISRAKVNVFTSDKIPSTIVKIVNNNEEDKNIYSSIFSLKNHSNNISNTKSNINLNSNSHDNNFKLKFNKDNVMQNKAISNSNNFKKGVSSSQLINTTSNLFSNVNLTNNQSKEQQDLNFILKADTNSKGKKLQYTSTLNGNFILDTLKDYNSKFGSANMFYLNSKSKNLNKRKGRNIANIKNETYNTSPKLNMNESNSNTSLNIDTNSSLSKLELSKKRSNLKKNNEKKNKTLAFNCTQSNEGRRLFYSEKFANFSKKKTNINVYQNPFDQIKLNKNSNAVKNLNTVNLNLHKYKTENNIDHNNNNDFNDNYSKLRFTTGNIKLDKQNSKSNFSVHKESNVSRNIKESMHHVAEKETLKSSVAENTNANNNNNNKLTKSKNKLDCSSVFFIDTNVKNRLQEMQLFFKSDDNNLKPEYLNNYDELISTKTTTADLNNSFVLEEIEMKKKKVNVKKLLDSKVMNTGSYKLPLISKLLN